MVRLRRERGLTQGGLTDERGNQIVERFAPTTDESPDVAARRIILILKTRVAELGGNNPRQQLKAELQKLAV